MKNLVKKMLSATLISIFIASGGLTYANSQTIEDITVKTERISEDEETITITAQSSEKLETDIAEYFGGIQLSNIDDGVETVVQTYSDGSKLILVSEDLNKNPLTRASRTANKRFNFYYQNIFGVRTLGFEVNIKTSYYDGTSGYIYNMSGTWKKHNGNFSLSWDSSGSKSTKYLYALSLNSRKGTENGYHIFMSSYAPSTGNLSISAY